MKFNSPLFKTLVIGPVFLCIVAFLTPLGIFMATRHRVGGFGGFRGIPGDSGDSRGIPGTPYLIIDKHSKVIEKDT